MAKEYFVKEEDIDILKDNVDNKISSPNTATVGQILSVKAVDENGKPTEWEVIDKPGSGPGESSPYIYMTQAEYEALTEYEQDRMYWVTYPVSNKHWIWKNGEVIEGEGHCPTIVIQDSSSSYIETLATSDKKMVIGFNCKVGTSKYCLFKPEFLEIINIDGGTYDGYYPDLKEVYFGKNVTISSQGFQSSTITNIHFNSPYFHVHVVSGSNMKVPFANTTWLKTKIQNNPLVIEHQILVNAINYSQSELVIPDNIVNILGEAFRGNTYIKKVTIPDSVVIYGDWLFYSSKVEEVETGNVVEHIDRWFDSCSNLKKVVLGNKVKSITSYTFLDCTRLPDITIPNSVETIGYNCFSGCSALKTITINKPQDSVSGAPWGATNATVVWNG